jgi:diguanylate cyclase (GGDEF)-like protein/PAS domain S-box-containing protein
MFTLQAILHSWSIRLILYIRLDIKKDNIMTNYEYDKFFELSLDMLCIAGADGYFKCVNSSFERIIGWTKEELLSQHFTNFIHPDDVTSSMKEMEKLNDKIPTLSFTNRYRCKNGQYKSLSWTAFPDPESHLLYAVAHDISELEELSALASTDFLTNLYNRTALTSRFDFNINLMSRIKRPLSVLMVDVDFFKKYNDSHGHLAGDEALKTIASLLTNSLRTTDVVARFGGEEFAIILPDTKEEDAIHMAERCQTAITNNNWIIEPVTVSIGVSTQVFSNSLTSTKDSETIRTDLLSKADQALYKAKENGRNCIIHFSNIDI